MDKDSLKKIDIAQKTQCHVPSFNYELCQKFVKDLREEGLAASIVSGGVLILANVEDERVLRVCKKYKFEPSPGMTRMMENIYLK